MKRDVHMLRMSMKGRKALAFGDMEWIAGISEQGIGPGSVCGFIFLSLLAIE
jgi:hypothetical protein